MQYFNSVIPGFSVTVLLRRHLRMKPLNFLLILSTSVSASNRSNSSASLASHDCQVRYLLVIYSLPQMWCGTIVVISYGTTHAAKVVIILVLDFWWIVKVANVLHEYGFCSCACVYRQQGVDVIPSH